ncbi:TetR/AcrR family transcriptional regulator [Kitasatospora sp. MMS16-BH015]|uniref:TetR/AcrR family transcriptional regulator n=1 Tax=Kitasatospora sp. MMS16-BH015 TaxID=2018025 RepID=UPI0020C3B712|nr:TetR/AcrR family transcriptional regulator [Kitasatospora sp. MMS16-BH015]
MRADACRNRERIITAAREIFVEQGAEVPFDEIARRAGVGNATLYRNFADRRDLAHHVTLAVMTSVADQADKAAAEEPDSFAALSRFVHAAADERIGALCPMINDHVDHSAPDIQAAKDRLDAAVTELVSRAHASGQLRADVGAGDLVVALAQLTRPLPGSACLDLEPYAHRYLQLLLDGLRAPAATELPGRATTLEDLRRHL